MELDQAPPHFNYFADDEYLHTDVAAGVAANRANTRVVALPSAFFDALDRTLAVECGAKAAQVLKNAGRQWGRRSAEQIERELEVHLGEPIGAGPVAQFETVLQSAFSRLGWGMVALDFSRYAHGIIMASVQNLPTAAASESLLAGALAGVFSHFAGRELDCVAIPGVGALRSFVLSLPERLIRIGDSIKARRSCQDVLAELATIRA